MCALLTVELVEWYFYLLLLAFLLASTLKNMTRVAGCQAFELCQEGVKFDFLPKMRTVDEQTV